jgi:hypothetical protein
LLGAVLAISARGMVVSLRASGSGRARTLSVPYLPFREFDYRSYVVSSLSASLKTDCSYRLGDLDRIFLAWYSRATFRRLRRRVTPRPSSQRLKSALWHIAPAAPRGARLGRREPAID